MMKESRISIPVQIAVISLILFMIGVRNYPLFHALSEILTAVISFGIFSVAWATRKYARNDFLLLAGAGYFFVGMMDLFQVLAYQGAVAGSVGALEGSSRIWIAARVFESLVFLAALVAFRRAGRVFIKRNIGKIFLCLLAVFSLIMMLAFSQGGFPRMIDSGIGTSRAYWLGESMAFLFFALSAWLLHKKKNLFDREMSGMLFLALILKILAEATIAGRLSGRDFSEMIGHLLRFASAFLVYKALLEGGLMKPYRFMFSDLKKSENDFRRSQARCQAILENHTELLCRFRPDKELTFVNSAYCRYFGKHESELLGSRFFPESHPDDGLKVEESMRGVTQAHPVREIEYRVVMPGGTVRWHRWNLSGIFNDKGRIIEYQSLRQDITDKKNSESELDRIRSEQRRSMEDQLTKSYEYLGAVNRRMSILLDIEAHSKEVSKKNRQKIADYILSSALNITKASCGLIYRYSPDGNFHLFCREGCGSGSGTAVPSLVSSGGSDFLKRMISGKTRVNGPSGLMDIDGFLAGSGLDYAVALPFVEDGALRGFMFLGFKGIRSMDSQELEFLDVFSLHASRALLRAGALG